MGLAELQAQVRINVFIEYQIQQYIEDAERQIDQIRRRVIEGEKIPHEKKVFSIFEPDVEWIVKGKAVAPMELGIKVCIIEDQYQFILNHKVMRKQTDDQVAIAIIEETKRYFSNLKTCSFDKGFHSPENQKRLNKSLDNVALSHKGKRSKKIKELESSEAWQTAHAKHSAVESAINALQVHGLDLCPDRGRLGFDRYVALAIVARNLQRIGAILIAKDKAVLERTRKKQLKLAA